MSNQLLNLVWVTNRYSGATLLTLIYLSDRANDEAQCWPSVDTIARYTKQSRRAVFRSLKTLERDRVLQRSTRNTRSGKKSNLYKICIDKLGGSRPLVTQSHRARDTKALRLVTSGHPTGDSAAPESIKKPQPETQEKKTRVTAKEPRHAEVRNVIREACEKNQVPFIWDHREDKVLADWLRATPRLALEEITKLIHHRFRTDGIPLGERPWRWIADLGRYAEGPLDQFNRLKNTQHSEATVGMRR
jgi:GntR family transcriptional regulator